MSQQCCSVQEKGFRWRVEQAEASHAAAWATGAHVEWWETAEGIAVPGSVAEEAGAGGGLATADVAGWARPVGVAEQRRRRQQQRQGQDDLLEEP